MSPYLFVIAMEYFSRMMGAKNKAFKFHPKCHRIGINHICFADDLMVFCRGDISSTKLISETLEDFSKASGLKINASKSTLFMGGERIKKGFWLL